MVSSSDPRAFAPDPAAAPAAAPAPRPATPPRSAEPPVDLDDGAPARCHVRLSADHTGLATVLTGLSMLARRRRAQLSWEWVPPPRALVSGPWHLRDKATSNAEMIVDGRHSVFIDIHDSFELDESALASHDVYFKRSLNAGALAPNASAPARPHRARLHALGLVNDVHPDGFDLQEARRVLARPWPWRQRATSVLALAASTGAGALGLGGRSTLSLMTGPPTRTRDPKVLFMAGLWDPALVPDAAPDKIAEFEAVNEMRAECIRALRREFGQRFFGGVQHSEFARRHFPDVLLERSADGSKRAFLDRVRRSAICVTTTGLHGSIGWKFVEYVGLSRAIVTEPLRYVVPGEFGAGRNYLGFTSPEECVAQVTRLIVRDDEREAIMEANQQYTSDWMRPDRLAWRMIRAARERG